MEGGLIQNIEGIPKGYIVKVIDFDAKEFGYEEEDVVEFDESGNPAWVTFWRSQEELDLIERLANLCGMQGVPTENPEG